MKTITIDLSTPADPAAQLDVALGLVASADLDEWITLVTGCPQAGMPRRFAKTEQDTFDIRVVCVADDDASEAALGRLASRVARIDQRCRRMIGMPLLRLRLET